MTETPQSQRTQDDFPYSEHLLAWYDRNARELPWRVDPPDPYRTWVSEIMLQQTRADTVKRYFERFLDAFPDVHALAAASDDDLLLLWEGLGYYRRARNLRNAARIVSNDWLNKQGRWPGTLEEWDELPGIGPYTAAAIASISFDVQAAVVDGNVKRVLARVFSIEKPVNSSKGETAIQQRADELVPVDRPGDHNQALMELGATVCLPKNPRCGECPWRGACVALAEDRISELPLKTPKKAVPHKRVAAAVILRKDGAILIRRRPDDGMLGGLWELPSVTLDAVRSETDQLLDHIHSMLHESGSALSRAQLVVGEPLARTNHAYSHFTVEVTARDIRVVADSVAVDTGRARQGNDRAFQSFDQIQADTSNLAWLTRATRNRFAFHRAHDKLLNLLWDAQTRLFF